MIELTVVCKTCSREFEPDHADYIRGRWRTCPDCRQPPRRRSRYRPPADHPSMAAQQSPRADDEPHGGIVKEST